MSHIFISYSRKDINFAGKIVEALADNNLETWIDWKSIPKGEAWEQEIYRGIEEADAFLFLISPDSAISEMCNKEVAHAVKNNKRILPIVLRDTDVNTFLYELAKTEISKRNWVFCREKQDDFDKTIEEIQTTIHTDYEWVQTQRRFQVKALEWERNYKENSFLLRGKDLEDAEIQLAINSSKEPFPSQLQSKYVFESRKYEDTQKRLSQRRKNIYSVIGIVLLIMIVLAINGQLNSFVYRPIEMEDYWVTVPAGEFIMGSSINSSGQDGVHVVYLDTYEIGKYEITNQQYLQCVYAGICFMTQEKINEIAGKEKYPVTGVSWFDADRFCRWIDPHGHLPTEAQWEKAARGTDGRIFPWGNHIDESYANFGFFINAGSVPVGSYEKGKSIYGAYDMIGNVWEWVADEYDSNYYLYSPNVNPSGPDSNTSDQSLGTTDRVIRGGGWWDAPENLSSAARGYEDQHYPRYEIGFRCSRDVFTDYTSDGFDAKIATSSLFTVSAYNEQYPSTYSPSDLRNFAATATMGSAFTQVYKYSLTETASNSQSHLLITPTVSPLP